MLTRPFTLAAVLALFPLVAFATQTEPPPAQPSSAQPVPTPAFAPVRRADLARELIRFERTLQQFPVTGARTAEINRRFDAATLQFFSGAFGPVAREVAYLRRDLLPEGDPRRAVDVALRAEVQPPTAILGSGQGVTITLERQFASSTDSSAAGVGLAFLRRVDAVPALTLAPDRLTWTNEAVPSTRATLQLSPDELAALGAGTFDLALTVADSGSARFTLPVGQLVVASESLDALRERLAARLAVLLPREELAQAIAAVKARLDLLTNLPSTTNSASFLADPIQLGASLEREIADLEAGRDPYIGRTGDLWRVLRVGGETSLPVPIRQYVPAGADGPLPVIITLHGAGGDEAMFLEAYGSGLIRRLADQHHFIVVSPLTTMFTPRAFDVLLATLEREHTIDTSRIYALGHSMGSAPVQNLARVRRSRLAAGALIAGGAPFRFGGEPALASPLLLIAGALDPIARAPRLREVARTAQVQGLRLEYRELDDQGHTLIVGHTLADAVDWLLARRLTPDDPAPQPAP